MHGLGTLPCQSVPEATSPLKSLFFLFFSFDGDVEQRHNAVGWVAISGLGRKSPGCGSRERFMPGNPPSSAPSQKLAMRALGG